MKSFGHVRKRDKEYVGRRRIEMDPPGKRNRGRLKRRFKDALKGDGCNKRRSRR